MNKSILAVAVIAVLFSGVAILNQQEKVDNSASLSDNQQATHNIALSDALEDFRAEIFARAVPVASNEVGIMQQLTLMSKQIDQLTMTLTKQREDINKLENNFTLDNRLLSTNVQRPSRQEIETYSAQKIALYDEILSTEATNISDETTLSNYFQSAVEDADEYPGLAGASISEANCAGDLCRMKIERESGDENLSGSQFEQSLFSAVSGMASMTSGTLRHEDDGNGRTITTLYLSQNGQELPSLSGN